jgi:two-component system alkaline phosphatase synthesis response regulator PhoP
MFSEKTQLLLLSEETRGRALQACLEPVGFCVTVKQTILAGIRFVEAAYPALVIIGSPLHDATIFEGCRQLREIRCPVPIIVYVEHADEYDRILTLEIGADDYIAEMVKPRELIARIRAQLRRAYEYSKPGTDVLHVGDLVVDCARGQAFRGPYRLDLTPIEFRLLVLLTQHRGQVLSRAQILDQIWGHSLRGGDQMVNVHICRLRRKIESDLSKPGIILTVPGLGYRLVSSIESVSAG